MEPGLGDREWAADAAQGIGRRAEPQWSPVLETGNGCDPENDPPQERVPQWSPVLETGNGSIRRNALTAALVKPQWSPVLETGNGRCHWLTGRSRRRRRNGARSWRPGMAASADHIVPTVVAPQWSPVLETGNGHRPLPVRPRDRQAAMEPGLGDREWYRTIILRVQRRSGPQWSPVLETGNGSASSRPDGHGTRPQWSPVLETGNGSTPSPPPSGGPSAAMEPGLGDREWRPTQGGPAQKWGSRNGARSWRPGMAPTPGQPHTTASSRNGARSWRPGMDPHPLATIRRLRGAAMEPGLGDREWWPEERDQ